MDFRFLEHPLPTLRSPNYGKLQYRHRPSLAVIYVNVKTSVTQQKPSRKNQNSHKKLKNGTTLLLINREPKRALLSFIIHLQLEVDLQLHHQILRKHIVKGIIRFLSNPHLPVEAGLQVHHQPTRKLILKGIKRLLNHPALNLYRPTNKRIKNHQSRQAPRQQRATLVLENVQQQQHLLALKQENEFLPLQKRLLQPPKSEHLLQQTTTKSLRNHN